LILNGKNIILQAQLFYFSTAKNIIVNTNVGSAINSTASSLDGWYVAGQSFFIYTAGNCNDLRLNVGGAVIVNSLGVGGIFQNNRDLCGK